MEIQTLIKYAKNLHRAKNTDYGNSFDATCNKFGVESASIRMHDKISRIQRLMMKNEQNVKDESIFDTWYDLVNYALMTAAYIDQQVGQCKDSVAQFDVLLDTTFSQIKFDIAEESDISKCEELNDSIWEYMRSDDRRHDKLKIVRKYAVQIAKIAFDNCLKYDESMLNPKYL